MTNLKTLTVEEKAKHFRENMMGQVNPAWYSIFDRDLVNLLNEHAAEQHQRGLKDKLQAQDWDTRILCIKTLRQLPEFAEMTNYDFDRFKKALINATGEE